MTKSILCAVIGGILVGAVAFFMPHLLFGIIIFFAIFRILHCCCRSRHSCCGSSYGGHNHDRLFYMSDKIRKMSDVEYAEFKTHKGGGCCNSGYHSHCCCNSGTERDFDCMQDTKKEEKPK